MSFRITSRSPEETERLGFEIGRLAAPGLLVALRGELGAGKTLLTKGIARGLGVENPRYVTSPTFTLHRLHQGRLTLHHLDFYRLGAESDLEDLGLEETLAGSGVSVVEWPDKFFSFLGPDRLDVAIGVTGEEERRIEFSWSGPTASRVGEALRDILSGGAETT